MTLHELAFDEKWSVESSERVKQPKGARMGVAACLAFRNSSRYLREWLLFHLAAGVDYFFLYNNDSTDSFEQIVRQFVAVGVAEVIEWPGLCQQLDIYNDCMHRSRGRYEWVAFIDDDEFLWDSDGASLCEALLPYRGFAGLAVPWYLYGTSGKLYYEEEYVIRRFQLRRKAADQHHKCIVRPACVERALVSGHLFEPIPGQQIVGQRLEPITTPTTDRPQTGRLRVNHYLTKSVEEMIERRTSRAIDTGNEMKLTLSQWMEFEKTWNEVADFSATAMIPRMQEVAARIDSEACNYWETPTG